MALNTECVDITLQPKDAIHKSGQPPFQSALGNSSPADRARLLSVSSPHAASWISVIPSEGLGLHLEPSEFQVAIKWWLGIDTSSGAMCALCPGSVLGPLGLGHHTLTCKRGGDVVSRHNKLRDTLAEACRRAHLSVKVEAGCNLTLDHSHSRLADILVPNWSVGKPAPFDLSVTQGCRRPARPVRSACMPGRTVHLAWQAGLSPDRPGSAHIGGSRLSHQCMRQQLHALCYQISYIDAQL